jgi:hypothetical protein
MCSNEPRRLTNNAPHCVSESVDSQRFLLMFLTDLTQSIW